jgi:hypothetical protein
MFCLLFDTSISLCREWNKRYHIKVLASAIVMAEQRQPISNISDGRNQARCEELNEV